jgi:hypothetical protein
MNDDPVVAVGKTTGTIDEFGYVMTDGAIIIG